jgi:phosphoribosylformimino-5-aminoimidazole carboxamide ribotide isomerase
MLVIPAIQIRNGRCVQMVQGIEGHDHSDDPVEMARLWRIENAKTLQVADMDGLAEGRVVNEEVIRRMVRSVDIPIELGGGLWTFDAVAHALDLGLYRVVVGAMIVEKPDEAQRAIDRFGPSKTVLGIDAVDGIVAERGRPRSTHLTAMTVALNAKLMGFRRIEYTELRSDGSLRGVNLKILRELGEKTGMRITASGGITSLEELLQIQELLSVGVDSVVIGRALYENRFSCQQLWRQCEARNYPYTAKV